MQCKDSPGDARSTVASFGIKNIYALSMEYASSACTGALPD